MLKALRIKRRILTAAASLLMGVSVGVGTAAAETRPEITVGLWTRFPPRSTSVRMRRRSTI